MTKTDPNIDLKPQVKRYYPKEILTLRIHEGADLSLLKRDKFEKLMLGPVWDLIEKRQKAKKPPLEWVLAHPTSGDPHDPVCWETGRYEVSVCDAKGTVINYLCIQYCCDDKSRFEQCTQI